MMNGSTSVLKNPGIGTNSLMAMMSRSTIIKEASQLTRPDQVRQPTEYKIHTDIRGGEGGAREKRRPGIGTDYLMAMIYVKEFRNQGGVAAYKAASRKTADLICKYTQI